MHNKQQALQDAIDQSDFLKDAKIVIAKEQKNTPSVAIASRLPWINHKAIGEFPEAALLQLEGRSDLKSHSACFGEYRYC